jgi:hypothetical protein
MLTALRNTWDRPRSGISLRLTHAATVKLVSVRTRTGPDTSSNSAATRCCSSTIRCSEVTCLWYGTWRTDTVRVILVRDTGKKTTPASG